MRWAVVAVTGLALGACTGPAVVVPVPEDAHPPAAGVLRAGLARANITPDPAARPVGLGGYGPDGRRARGVRDSLWARALVLEDPAGARVALVTVDLPMMAARIHRMVALRVAAETGIGPDRLVIAATHTHAGPAGISDAAYYNRFGSAVEGYDSLLVLRITDSVAAAVRAAFGQLAPARIAWGTVPIWGTTWNRSYGAFVRNPTRGPHWDAAPEDIRDSARAVDPTWLLLRVDRRDAGSGEFRPAGAFNVFAMHPTFVPNVNDEIDPDIFGDLAQAIEQRLAPLTGGGRPVVALANGTEGDVTGAWPPESRCPPPRLRPGPRAPGPRAGPPAPAFQDVSPARRRRCIEAAHAASERLAAGIADEVVALIQRLRPADGVTIRSALRVVPLRGGLAPPELCDEPLVGLAQPGGSSEDGRSRLHGFELLHLVGGRLAEGGEAARREPAGCHGHKRPIAAPLQLLLARLGGAPDIAQVSLVQIGDVLLATLPAEVTTMAGEQMRAAIRDALGERARGTRHIGIVSLVNGYMQYVTTAEEYAAQHYEGASNLYGPGTTAMFARVLGEMAAGGPREPPGAVRVWPW